jgi:hypothetical protein
MTTPTTLRGIDLEQDTQLSLRLLHPRSEYELEILCSNGYTSPFHAEEGWWAMHVHGLPRFERQISQESVSAAAYRRHTSPAGRSKIIHRTRHDMINAYHRFRTRVENCFPRATKCL